MLSGYYFYTADGTKTEGSVNINNASDITISGSHTYNSGYYPTQWTVSGLDTSDATAAAENIETGYTAYVNGAKIVGTMVSAVNRVTKYTGTISTLSENGYRYAAASVGNYGLLACGATKTTVINVYNSSLQKSTANTSSARAYGAGASNSVYAIIGCGSEYNQYNQATYSQVVDAFNSSLSRSNAPNATQVTTFCGGTSLGDYAIIAGGSGSNLCAYVNAYNTTLTKTNPENLSNPGGMHRSAASNTNYALFFYANSSNQVIDVYDTDLTHSLTNLGITQIQNTSMYAASFGEYAVFLGGKLSNYTMVNSMRAFNSNLTRSTYKIYPARERSEGISTNNYVIFAGGHGEVQNSGSSHQWYFDIVEAFDKNFTRFECDPLIEGSDEMSAVRVGNYALFGMGSVMNTSSTHKADVYAYYES